MAVPIRPRRGTQAEFAALNRVYVEAELLLEEQPDGTYKLKVGDGQTAYNQLAYLSGTGDVAGDVVFGSVAVPGQSTIVADTTAATLNLAGSTGISITTNATTDTVTFAPVFGSASGTICQGDDTRLGQSFGWFNVKNYGALGNGTGDDSAEIIAAIDAADAAGGGIVFFPPGTYRLTGQLNVGDGSNSAQSSKHHRIVLQGSGIGTGPEVSNTQADGVTRLLFAGAASATASVVSFEGPLHSVGLRDMVIDAAGLAGIAVGVTHCTQARFERVVALRWTANSYKLTTRTGFPAGVAYGNADNRFEQCYAFNANSNAANGIFISSGWTGGGAPSADSCRNTFIGGTYFYGGNGSTSGIWLSGADNNWFAEMMLIPSSGHNGGGNSIYFEQWPTAGDFPKENYFSNIGMTQSVGANGNVGGSGGNTFHPFQEGDGAPVPSAQYCNAFSHTGTTYINGTRAWRGRQLDAAKITAPVSTTSTSYSDAAGLSVTISTLSASTKLYAVFSGRFGKTGSGSGYVTLSLDGSDIPSSLSEAGATGFYASITCVLLETVGQGSHTVKVRFASSNTNAATIQQGVLVVKECY